MTNSYKRKIPLIDCGHEYIRKVLYGRWKIVLLLYISRGINRPGKLSRSIPQASRRVLDAQIAQLLEHNLIKKEVFDENILHVEYSLTDLGESIMPIIYLMKKWGEDHIEELRKVVK